MGSIVLYIFHFIHFSHRSHHAGFDVQPNQMAQLDSFLTKPENTSGIYNQSNQTKQTQTYVLSTPEQRSYLQLQSRRSRFEEALERMQNKSYRQEVDPLNEDNFVEPTHFNRIAVQPQVKYLGILVDAGRHYFPIPWLKRLIQFLYRLRFNMIHFRLTDDQAFNVQLESYPQLALASAAETRNTTYKPKQLRYLVKYALRYNITIIPEINLPGHAGAWSGIPGLILHCPNFACQLGYGIPLNVNYPNISTILKAVIQEVIEIFDNPPFLHLGGDEVERSVGCFSELGLNPFQYDNFELQLQQILREINYPQNQVIRWEVTGPNASTADMRAGGIQHNWYYLPGESLDIKPHHVYFNSWRLYMDANDNEGAAQIFKHTIDNFQPHLPGADHMPRAIIPASFELNVELWSQRNVAARLIAVALGAANWNTTTNTEQAFQLYDKVCRDLGLHPTVCDLQGFTSVPNVQYREHWNHVWQQWINGTCERVH